MVIVFYYICQSCVQCSILFFYLRLGIATTRGHRMRWIIYALMGASALNNAIGMSLGLTFSFVRTFIFQSAKYNLPLWLTYGTLNLLLDLIIWSLPLPTVLSVMKNVSTRKKILLVLVFVMGMMCWCSAILRISLRKHISELGRDPSYNAGIFYVLYIVEPALAISCVSLATLRPLVVKITKGFNRLRGKPTSTSRSRPTGYEFGGSPGLNQSNGHGSRQARPGGPKAVRSKGGFGDPTIVGEELVEWKDDALDITRSQFVQQACGCPYKGEGGHTSSCPKRLDPARGTHIQIPPPTATDLSTSYRSSSASSGETLRTTNPHHSAHSRPPVLPSSESTVNLTNADTNATTNWTPGLTPSL